MKKWTSMSPTFTPRLEPIPEPKPFPIPTDVHGFRCTECYVEEAHLIYKGSTFCEGCLKKQRSIYGL